MTGDLRTVFLKIAEPDDAQSPYRACLVLYSDGDVQTLAEHELARALPPVLASAREVVAADDEVSSDRVNEIGAALHAALGDVGEAWRERAWRSGADAQPARVLLDVRPPDLASLPWEMLFDAEEQVYPFGRPAEPAARIAPSYDADADPPDREYWPLRILVVVGTHEAKVKALEEVTLMDDALVRLCADIDLEVLHRPPREKLLEALRKRRPHILHFIGHGLPGGALEIDPEEEDVWDWTTTDIRMDLPHKPRLVVVNACRTGGVPAHEGTMSVARAFLGEEVRAVIAMQGPIDGNAAARFSKDLYTALADREPLDVAVARGRQGIAAPQDVKWSSRDTWLPTLVLGVPPDVVLPPRYRVQSTRANQIRNLVQPLGPFVDRREDRRTVLSRLEVYDGDDDEQDDDRLLMIAGQRKAGKTVLVKWAVAQLAYRGEAAVYVNLDAGKQRPRFAFVMEQIGRAMCDALWAGESPTPLDEFTEQLERMRAAEAQPTEEEQRQLCVTLVNALASTSQESQLIIALDQIEEVFQQDYGELLAQKLLRPIAAGAAAKTRVILVHHGASATVFDELKPARVATLGCIDAGTVMPYVRQYILYHENVDKTLVKAILTAVEKDDKDWLPIQFPRLMQAFGLELDPHALT